MSVVVEKSGWGKFNEFNGLVTFPLIALFVILSGNVLGGIGCMVVAIWVRQ